VFKPTEPSLPNEGSNRPFALRRSIISTPRFDSPAASVTDTEKDPLM
jgi:hypothetical protein